MYNAVVVQYSNGCPIRTFPATVTDGRITASAFLRDTGLEGTPLYEEYLRSHILSRNTTFGIVDDPAQLPDNLQELPCSDSSFL